jgi:hypothetical protein
MSSPPRRYPNRYAKQAMLGLLGISLICSPFFFKLPAQFSVFNFSNQIETETKKAKAEIEGSEQVEIVKIEQRKTTADALKKAGVMPSGNRLKIRRYYDNSKHDPKPETSGFLAAELVYVYDSSGVCIGRIQNKKWLWKYYFTYACDNAQVHRSGYAVSTLCPSCF